MQPGKGLESVGEALNATMRGPVSSLRNEARAEASLKTVFI